MRHYAALFLAVLGAGFWERGATQYSDVLYSDNGIPWRGEYGWYDGCPESSSTNVTFTYALDFKYDDLDDLDFIGGDSVMLYCQDDDGYSTGYVSSLQGSNGEWQGIHTCPEGEYFMGFRLRVFPEQGTWGDDFAVDNIQLACSDGTIVDGLDGVIPPSLDIDIESDENDDEGVLREIVEKMGRRVEMLRSGTHNARLHGNWGTWAYCSPGMYVMGIRTVVEEGHIDDDAGLTDVTLYCA